MLGTAGDEDLLRHGGQAPRGVPPGDRLAQHGQAVAVVPVAVQVGGQRFHRGRQRGRNLRTRLGRGQGQVEGVLVIGYGGDPRGVPPQPSRRECGDAAGPLTAGQVTLIAQQPVGGRDRGAAQPQRRREPALGGQPRPGRHPGVQQQRPQGRGQPRVTRCHGPARAACLRALPVTEEPDELALRDAPHTSPFVHDWLFSNSQSSESLSAGGLIGKGQATEADKSGRSGQDGTEHWRAG